MKIGFAVAALASAGLLVSATASSAAPLSTRQYDLNRRIEQGTRNGSLTRHEADSLRRQLSRIERTQYDYRRGGLSRWERRDLERRYDALSRQVRRQRHDAQRRY